MIQHTQRSSIATIAGVPATKLGNEREVRVYLPPGYDDEIERRYPVLYMHVGQHVFEPTKPSGHSWRMHETIDRLIADNRIEPILLVAVEHRYEEGTSEYFHDLCAYPIRCTGELYEHFLVHELKPMIDVRFRTLPGPENTALMGSSAAGIATYNIGLRNPGVFGKLGILSPFFVQVDPVTLAETKQYREYELPGDQRVWLDIGGEEGFFMPRHVKEAADRWLARGAKQGANLFYYHDPEAAHSEKDWGDRAHMPLLYFFGSIGKAARATLNGPDEVGLSGPTAYVNAVVDHDSGFRFSDLQGRYESGDPEILEVAPDGRLLPRKAGTATIRYEYGDVVTERTYRVVDRLSELVKVELDIEVPPNTPDDARVYTTFEVPKIAAGRYGGTIRLPRGMAFQFHITRGYDQEEADKDYRPIAPRRFATDRDVSIRYKVDNWIDLRPAAIEEER